MSGDTLTVDKLIQAMKLVRDIAPTPEAWAAHSLFPIDRMLCFERDGTTYRLAHPTMFERVLEKTTPYPAAHSVLGQAYLGVTIEQLDARDDDDADQAERRRARRAFIFTALAEAIYGAADQAETRSPWPFAFDAQKGLKAP